MSTAGKPVISQAARRSIDLRFVELMDKVRRSRPGDDLELLRRAYDFAAEQHKTQMRQSGEPYLSHPVEVAHILADMKLDVTSLCAALLHDVVEDTKIPLDKHLRTNLARTWRAWWKASPRSAAWTCWRPEARQAENVRKMLLAMVNDVRVVLVKLADRLHNMRTLEYLDCREAAAHRARNAGYLRAGREPAWNGLDPRRTRRSCLPLPRAGSVFRAAEESRDRSKKSSTSSCWKCRKPSATRWSRTEFPPKCRRASSASIRCTTKIQKQQRTLDQVYDLLAVRVITDTVKNCYAALGVIHQIWRPVPGRFKDYIAMPRPNLYQSLHTAVIHAGQPFEVQIRTQEMHRIAEQGVAAHWKYKDGARGRFLAPTISASSGCGN